MATTIELSVREIQGLCQRYLREDQIAENKVPKEVDLEVLNYMLKPTSDAPAGYLGRHQYFTVEVRLGTPAGDDRTETLSFFIKSAPTEVSRAAYLEEFGVFKKEILIYRDVLPEVERIFAPVAPKCYYENGQLLVFENLAHEGYRMAADRDGLLNYEHLNYALKTLAVMHSASLVYEQRTGRSLPELHGEALVENAYPMNLPPNHVRLQNFQQATAVCLEIIKTLPQYEKKQVEILHGFSQQMAKIFQLAQTSMQYTNVLCHGDIWANNVMFKYGNFGEIPIECRFVDFQLARYAPALLDVMTLLTIPTSREFRESHLDELLADYYRFMTEFLKRAGLTVEQHFMSSTEYWHCAEVYRIAGLIESCLFSHLTILPPKYTQQLTGSTDGFTDFFTNKRVAICMQAYAEDQVYRERLVDMISDIVDNFVLKASDAECTTACTHTQK